LNLNIYKKNIVVHYNLNVFYVSLRTSWFKGSLNNAKLEFLFGLKCRGYLRAV